MEVPTEQNFNPSILKFFNFSTLQLFNFSILKFLNSKKMGVFTSIKKKEDKEDERTVPASEFIERITKMQQEKKQLKDIPNTEMPKDN